MFKNAHKLYDLLTKQERKRGLVLLLLMLFVGVLQVGAVTSIMPFMAVASSPEIIKEKAWYEWLYTKGGFESTTGFLLSLGWFVFGMVVVTNLAIAGSVWIGARFVWDVHARLSKNLLDKYLARDYLWFVQDGTSDAGKNVLAEVQHFTNRVMRPLLDLVSNGLIAICLILLLMVVDWQIAFVAGGVIVAAYGGIYLFLRHELNRIGRKRVKANNKRFKVVKEAFGAFKELRAFQAASYFVGAYDKATWKYSRTMAFQQILNSLPKNFLEIVIFGSLVLLVIYLLRVGGDIRQIIPVLSVYAFAGYRLIPAVQKSFASIASLRFNQSLIDILYADYFFDSKSDVSSKPPVIGVPEQGEGGARIPFHKEIRFDGVKFSYMGQNEPALSEISLAIPRGHAVALCGHTGSGKSTFTNLLLGLFTPVLGEITIDGQPLDRDMIPNWKRLIGYVPQEIFLIDASILKNIAFGVDKSDVDIKAAEDAARMAQLHDFIVEELPEGYSTVVGERGVRLSGGQRQRLGIARALYHQPEVLLFDEATSALDSKTENDVMHEIRSMAGDKTIVIVAHRLSTVKDCDRIYVLEKGRIVAQGTYYELMDGDAKFRRLVGLS